MNQIRTSDLVSKICKDYNLDKNYKIKSYHNHFKVVNGKRKINASYHSIIVDKEGNESPYMLDQHVRNEEKLKNFDYIYTIQNKSISQVLQELNLELKTESCKICEGGGWHTEGVRYYYKDTYCEQ